MPGFVIRARDAGSARTEFLCGWRGLTDWCHFWGTRDQATVLTDQQIRELVDLYARAYPPRDLFEQSDEFARCYLVEPA